MAELRLPNIRGQRETERLAEMQAYLYQLVNDLNYYLNLKNDVTVVESSSAEVGEMKTVSWGNITGKPGTYPPSSHTHDDRYYTETEVNTLLSAKASINDASTTSTTETWSASKLNSMFGTYLADMGELANGV